MTRTISRSIFAVLCLATLLGFSIAGAPGCATVAMVDRGGGEADTKGALDVAEHTLDNGLKVLVVNRPGVSVVSSYVWYKVGSMDEPAGVTGVAHFLEHMMFKGSKEYQVGDVDKVTVSNGGSNNAFTSDDYTAYFINLPKSRWQAAMKIEADRMAHLTLDLGEFESEKKVVQSESDIARDDPSQRAWQEMMTAIYGRAHPYGHPTLGWPQDVQDTSRRDMRLFYERHYHPNHATLVLCGDITSAEAMPVIKDLFGRIPRGPELNRPKYQPVSFQGPVQIEVKGQSEIIEFTRGYVSVPAGHADEAPLDVLSLILGSGVTSRFYRSVVDEQRIAAQIWAGTDNGILGGGFYLGGAINPGRSRAELNKAVDACIEKLLADGLVDGELDRAKNGVIARSVFERESTDDIAQALGQSQTVRGDWRATLQFPERIKAVTAADVVRVARTYLKPEGCAYSWVVPQLTPGAASTAADAKAEPLPVKRHVLSNGLTVLLLSRPGLPVVSVSANVRAWRAAEAPAEAGLAALTGMLLDTGTKNYSKQQLAEAMEQVGGELSLGSSGGNFRVLSEHADLGLKLLAEGLQRPTFPANELELARMQILTGIEASKNETAWFSRNAAGPAVYGPQSAFGRPTEGSADTVGKFTREQVAGWHARWFRPDNCVIAAVGDFADGEMLKKIEAEFGGWTRPADALKLPQLKFSAPEKRSGEQVFNFLSFKPEDVKPDSKRVMVDHPEKDQVMVRLTCLGITRDDPDYIPLVVMDSILGTSPGFTDRFSRVLRDQMGLAYSTYANIARTADVFPGAFLGYIGTRPENVEKALTVMYELLEQIRTEPVSEEELRNAKDYLKGSFVFGLETTGQLAGLMINIERFNLGWDWLVKYTAAVEAVTAEDIMRVAQKHLAPERMVEVLAGPIQKMSAPVEEPGEDGEPKGGSK